MKTKGLLLILLLFVFFGCTGNTKEMGYARDDLPIGSDFSHAMELISKDMCIFGDIPYIIQASDPALCKNLEENQYYQVEGKVEAYSLLDTVRTEWLEIAMRETYGDVDLKISTPIIGISNVYMVEPTHALIDKLDWSSEMNQDMTLFCGSEIQEVRLDAVVLRLGSLHEFEEKDDKLFILPKNTISNTSLVLSGISFGTDTIEYKDGLEGKQNLVLIHVDGLSEDATLAEYDNYIIVSDKLFLCYSYHQYENEGWYYCQVDHVLEDASEIDEIVLTIDKNNELLCSNYQEMANNSTYHQ
jgi:hypothetical protein